MSHEFCTNCSNSATLTDNNGAEIEVCLSKERLANTPNSKSFFGVGYIPLEPVGLRPKRCSDREPRKEPRVREDDR